MAAPPITKAQLHPLVLMSITDTITRHISRSQQTPLVGGLIGQQSRDGITVEHNFDVLLLPGTDGVPWHVDSDFFQTRTRQLQEVHKEPTQLELVGIWTLCPSGASVEKALQKELQGILPEVLKINESPLILAFHVDMLVEQMGGQKSEGAGGTGVAKMPFTVYEPVSTEPQASSLDLGLEKGPVSIPEAWREIPWEMQTGEAEMIALEFVKTGAGNASRIRTGNQATTKTEEPSTTGTTTTPADQSTSKSKTTTSKASPVPATTKRSAADLFTPEEEEMLSFLNTRANAMRTLLARLQVIRDYLVKAIEKPDEASPEMMRAIKALLSRLPGVEEAKREQLEAARSLDNNTATATDAATGTSAETPKDTALVDAAMVSLLGKLSNSIQSTRELGGKFSVVDASKREGRRRDPLPSLSGGQTGYSEMDVMDIS